MKARLISYSQTGENLHVGNDVQELIAYCARVSNPSNQDNSETSEKLLRYLAKHKHWSPFEMVSACIEVETTRDIARQLLRHRSFSFQEFSQRYADSSLLGDKIPLFELRRQDEKNRQNSIDDVDPFLIQKYEVKIEKHFKQAMKIYQEMLKDGIAKECARFVLPLATPTRLYMTGSIRSWIHYIDLRASHGTQKEHTEIVNQIKSIFVDELPVVSEALEWV